MRVFLTISVIFFGFSSDKIHSTQAGIVLRAGEAVSSVGERGFGALSRIFGTIRRDLNPESERNTVIILRPTSVNETLRSEIDKSTENSVRFESLPTESASAVQQIDALVPNLLSIIQENIKLKAELSEKVKPQLVNKAEKEERPSFRRNTAEPDIVMIKPTLSSGDTRITSALSDLFANSL